MQGCKDALTLGCIDAFMQGCMDACMYGFMDSGMYGMDARMHAFAELRSIEAYAGSDILPK